MSDEKNQNEGAAPKKKSSLMTGIIAGVLVAVVFAVGIFIGIKVFGGGSHEAGKEDPKKEKTEKHAAEAEEDEENSTNKVVKIVVPTKEDLVFSPKGSPNRFVVVSLGFEVEDEKAKEIVDKELMLPIISDVQRKLRSYTVEELQSQGLQDSLPLILKREIKPYFHEIKLRNVYLSKFLIQ
ncbi:MAG: flagellar basal body-associated FliL family protein [Candidatus Kapaibacterium sp.]